jgi:hypothetical protein
METTRIKIKIGDHEFEAEGPADTVQSQFEAFREMISTIPRTALAPTPNNTAQVKQEKDDIEDLPHIEVGKVLHVAGRVVSLTALPKSTEDAALLIMLGHKDLRNNLTVTGQEIGDGLAQSGRPVLRVDRIMEKALGEALVLKTGIKRGTRYRLTNQGLTKALNVAKDLVASLP